MGLVRLSIDYEFSSQTWWDKGGRELWEAIAEGFDGSALVLDEHLAVSWLEQARQIPGWQDGPEHAPHPIAVAPADEDDDTLL
jgi:hypothetical protein